MKTYKGIRKNRFINHSKKKAYKSFRRKRAIVFAFKREITEQQNTWRVLNISDRKNYSSTEKHVPNFYKKKSKHEKFLYIEAPRFFSFIRNTIEVLTFINKLEKNIENRKPTFICLREVIEIDHDAIVVLRSIVSRFERKRIDFDGDLPVNSKSRKILLESGFFRSLADGMRAVTRQLTVVNDKRNSIHTHESVDVNVILADKLIKEASFTIWGKEKRCLKVYRMLLELMGNTHEHAITNHPGRKHWYLSVHHLAAENKVIFAFVDYGMGIINSIEQKKPGDKGYEFFRFLKSLFIESGSNAELFKNILNRSQRSNPTMLYRGHGLPSIYRALKNGDIRNLHFITNNVTVSTVNEEYIEINKSFSGTFVYWELDSNCNNLSAI